MAQSEPKQRKLAVNSVEKLLDKFVANQYEFQEEYHE